MTRAERLSQTSFSPISVFHPWSFDLAEEMEVSKILVQSEVGEKYESPDLLEFDLMGPNMT